ncbi:hypothetical protein [Aureimonas sp. AU22]|uniref:hypothetical protein n=1 Tax=Aureimonas sp. AU22 TaxID=1638162 RepID=UPI000780C2D2|nr:hypothetical protein [Aureimonas sp. AU22]
MDRTVPAGAARLLDFIRDTEVGTEARSGYDIIFGHNQDKLPKPVTSMTVDEVLGQQQSWSSRFGSSATGGYQFMRATLSQLKSELKLRGAQVMEPNLQDRLGYHLLKRRGYEKFVSGQMDRTEFAKRLAQEWASFPVLIATRGQHRQISRGQSFYAGDGLNKALVKPEAIEGILAEVLDLAAADAVAPIARPEPEDVIVVEVPSSRPAEKETPAMTDKPLTPIEQMNKPVKGAQAGVVSGGIGAALILLVQSAGWLPAAWESGAPATALGLVVGGACTLIGNFLGAYLARDKRFQSERSV